MARVATEAKTRGLARDFRYSFLTSFLWTALTASRVTRRAALMIYENVALMDGVQRGGARPTSTWFLSSSAPHTEPPAGVLAGGQVRRKSLAVRCKVEPPMPSHQTHNSFWAGEPLSVP